MLSLRHVAGWCNRGLSPRHAQREELLPQQSSGTCPGSQASCTWRWQTCLRCLRTRVHAGVQRQTGTHQHTRTTLMAGGSLRAGGAAAVRWRPVAAAHSRLGCREAPWLRTAVWAAGKRGAQAYARAAQPQCGGARWRLRTAVWAAGKLRAAGKLPGCAQPFGLQGSSGGSQQHHHHQPHSGISSSVKPCTHRECCSCCCRCRRSCRRGPCAPGRRSCRRSRAACAADGSRPAHPDARRRKPHAHKRSRTAAGSAPAAAGQCPAGARNGHTCRCTSCLSCAVPRPAAVPTPPCAFGSGA